MLQIPSQEIDADPIYYALTAARKFRVTVLLKGHQSIVANESRVIKLPAATSWLATAGTGDVLAGILGALIALNHTQVTHENLIEIGATASFIHAESAKHSSKGPIDAQKMITYITKEITRLSK